MPRYSPYATTVVGAYSVPRWYEALDRLVTMGQLPSGDFIDAQLQATQAAILEQETAGIDVITGGEMHRRTHNRHAPPNAMLNHFWDRIPAFHSANRPRPISPHDPNAYFIRRPYAAATSTIRPTSDLSKNSGQFRRSRANRSKSR